MTCRGLHPATRSICGHVWLRHEEKQSDVALAVRMIEDAYEGEIGTFYMLSCDTDHMPTLRMFQKKFASKGKRLVCVAPPSRSMPTEMQGHSNASITLKPANIKACLLPAMLVARDGSKIRRPADYTPPVGSGPQRAAGLTPGPQP